MTNARAFIIHFNFGLVVCSKSDAHSQSVTGSLRFQMRPRRPIILEELDPYCYINLVAVFCSGMARWVERLYQL